MPQEWSPPAQYYQSSQPPAQHTSTTHGEWTPPSYHSPPNAQSGRWTMPAGYQTGPVQPQQGPPSSPYPIPESPQAGHFSPVNPPPFLDHSQLKYIIPPKYNGDVVDGHGSKVYHLSTTHASSTVLSDPSGTTVGRIDWHKHESHTTISIRHNRWQRDQLLHPNKYKTCTFRVSQQAGGFTWKGFQNGIQCFDASGFKVAEFPYRTANVITLDRAHASLVELVIVTALLIHHEQSNRHSGSHGGLLGKTGEGATEGMTEAIAEAVIKGLAGGV